LGTGKYEQDNSKADIEKQADIFSINLLKIKKQQG
jgi:hypothetical protein